MATFALAAIAKNEARYLPEWVAYHHIRGAKFTRIYDNGSSDDTVSTIRKLSERLPVDVVAWPTQDNDFNTTQKRAYEDSAHFFANKVDFLALIDIDEFLASNEGSEIPDLLNDFDQAVAAIACQQVIFGSSGHNADTGELVISRFTRSAALDHGGCTWFKTIVRPDRLVSMETVHSVRALGKYVFSDGTDLTRPPGNPRQATRTCLSPLRLNHYALKSREEFRRKQSRMMEASLPDVIKTGYADESRPFADRDRHVNSSVGFSLDAFSPLVKTALASAGF